MSSTDNPYASPNTHSERPLKPESTASWWMALFGAIVCLLFLSNLDCGGFLPPFIFEIPDWIPGIGNIDEVLVTGILAACLSRLGIDIIPGLHRNRGQTIDHPPRDASGNS